MRTRLIHLAILVAFGGVVGHLAWSTLGPPGAGDYWLRSGDVTLQAAESLGGAKNLYLRRVMHLPDRPDFAWVTVLARDDVTLFVNGRLVERQSHDGYAVAVLADLTPHLRRGKNVLGIVARQGSVDRRPEVDVRGAYRIRGQRTTFGQQDEWRCGAVFERKADYWFAIDFDDSDWPRARRSPGGGFAARTAVPWQAVTTPNTGRWIAPQSLTDGQVTLRRDFELPERPRHGWLRLWNTTPFRLAVNGWVIAVQEQELGTSQPTQPVQRIYDLTPLLRRGNNFVSLVLTADHPPLWVQADIEVQGESGVSCTVSSDTSWQYLPGMADDWLAGAVRADRWHACQVEPDGPGIVAWDRPRRVIQFDLPWRLRARRTVVEATLIALLTLVTWGLTRLARQRIRTREPDSSREVCPLVLSLVPPAVMLAAAMLAVHDPRIGPQSIYRVDRLVAALGLVVLQWAVVGILARRSARATSPGTRPAPWTRRPGVIRAGVVLLLVVGGYLRIKDVAAEPLSADETSMYRATQGVFERGFPSIVISKDLPVVYAATSELVYFGTAVAELIFDDDRLVVRAPTVAWGILTIWLVFITGRRLFDPWVGLAAAALYAFSPVCIELSHVGRYYSQLQGLVLLTVYFFYRTIEPAGPLNRRALYLTVLCFVCMFLSWEASLLLAGPLVVAALIHRRRRVASLFVNPHVWIGMTVVGLVVLAQGAHRSLMQVLRPIYGGGATDVSLTPMWRYPGFDLWYYVRNASWTPDAVFALGAVAAAVLLTLRHPYHRSARTLLVIFVGLAFVQACLLPVTATRYAYHLLPMMIVLAAAPVVAVGGQLTRVGQGTMRVPLAGFSRWVAACVVVTFLSVGNGLAVQLSELDGPRGPGGPLHVLKNTGQEACIEYVKTRIWPDDIVIANGPHVVDVYLGRPTDYWLQTRMHLQATLDDVRTVPLHRLAGTPTITNLEQLAEVFGRHGRIWFLTDPSFNAKTNSPEASEFIRRNMDVVYEDFSALVMFRGDGHRPMALQDRGEATLRNARTPFLP